MMLDAKELSGSRLVLSHLHCALSIAAQFQPSHRTLRWLVSSHHDAIRLDQLCAFWINSKTL
jgi:hypothetical protein